MGTPRTMFSSYSRISTDKSKQVYVDDGLFFGSDDDTLSIIIKRLRDSGLNIEDQGHPADYVGVNIKRTRDGNYDLPNEL
eukprot:CCRYP_014430-RA/>CCRYP_014430-RA protein AED:0.47 eAED:0.47 QI:0/0/0/1/1/1/2/0/79